MYTNYQDEFLESIRGNDKYIYLTCFKKANNLGKPVEKWQNEDLDLLLASMESISANSIRKYIVVFREIHEFICSKEELKCQRLQPTKSITEYIDYKKLRSRILTHDDYQKVRGLLSFSNGGQEYNVRDKIMFELAWEGLSNSEIRYLKETDITWIRNQDGKILKVKLQLPDGRNVIIDDKVVVKDLESAVKENTYMRMDRNGKILFYPYRSTKFLIKPIAITLKKKNIDDDSVSNPSLMLKQVLSKINTNIKSSDGIELDLANLNLEDIRRSKIIYMLTRNKYLTVADIAKLFGKNVECDYYWLKEVSNQIYS